MAWLGQTAIGQIFVVSPVLSGNGVQSSMMATGDPGPIIGKGRAADVFDIGAGRVLRRNRDGSATELEAAAMQYLSRQGYPVPTVYDSDGADLVMERIHGSTMSNGLARQPWINPLSDRGAV